mmetsp:Transcript_21560/g.51902  ORF Transcript_21560/g.51902 Transcript_21560/m.51902 type:complete len:448 (+) Transcript_21560:104-1447(+)
MAPVVAGSAFKPKDKHLGSWDPTATEWKEEIHCFQEKAWGIRCLMNGANRDRFVFPLSIIEVVPGTEAEGMGLKVRDRISAIKPDDAEAWIQVVGEDDPIFKASKFVPMSLQEILCRGGGCQVKTRRENKLKKCKECGHDTILEILDQGDEVCENCGMVYAQRQISMKSEWRSFNDDLGNKADPDRAGAVEDSLFHHDKLQTTIAAGSWRSSGNDQAGSAANLSKNQYRGSNQNSDRALKEAFSKIDLMCERLGLNAKIKLNSKHMYKEVDDHHKEQKKSVRSTEALIVSCVYLACRDEGVPRTLKEMASVTEVTKKEMGKTFKHVQQLLGKTVQPTKPKDIVTRFCSNLGVSPELENLAIAISDAAASININEGRVYTSVAGAAIWMACLLRAGTKDQRSCLEIAHATGAAEATIRQTFRELHQSRDKLVPASMATPEQITNMPDH